MKKIPIPIEQQKAAVVRIVAGLATEAAEGRRLGRDKSTISDMVKKFGKEKDVVEAVAQLKKTTPTKPNESQPVTTPAGGEKKPEKTPIQAAKDAAGITSAPTPQVSGAGAVQIATDQDRKDAVMYCENLKATAAGLLADRYQIPSDDPQLEKAKQLSGLLRASIEANAPWLAPMLREKIGGGRWMFYAYIFLEARGLLRDTAAIALKHHPELAGGQPAPAPAPAPRPAAPPPTTPPPAPATPPAAAPIGKEIPFASEPIPGAGGLRIVRFTKGA